MSKSMFLALIVAGVLLGALLAGCGGTSGSSDAVVAEVGSTPITESMLNHWTATFVRGDFYQVNAGKAPLGLATDPPDYASCVKAAKTLAPSPSSGKRILTAAQLDHRCHILYGFVRDEALSYLISALWADGMSAEIGKHVSNEDVQRTINESIKKGYKTQQAFATYLANRGWSLSDMRYVVKRNLLNQKLTADAQRKAASLGGGERAFGQVLLQRISKWTKKTSCHAGFVVLRCKEYRAKKASTVPEEASPAVIFEEMNGGRYVSAAQH